MNDIVFQIEDEINNDQNTDIFLTIVEANNNRINLKITTSSIQTKSIKDIIEYINNNKIINVEQINSEMCIDKILHNLGMPSNIKGYQYIKDGIILLFNNNISSFTKDLYPTIAKKYDTNKENVERSMRHAIEISWNRGNWDLMEELFGYSIDQDKAKPTNKEYIITIVDYLKQKNKTLF